MDVDPPADPQQSYTIVRIKRKRNEEPLDALVVDSGTRRKKVKGGVNVFQYAETVEESAWDDEKQKKDIEARISSLARQSAKKGPQPPTTSSTTPVEPPPAHTPDPNRSYTVVQTELSEPPPRSFPTTPPKVISKKEYDQQQQPTFKMYDAIPSSSSLASAATAVPEETDPEIDNFLPMLQEYLRVNDINLSAPTTPNINLVSGDDDYVWDVFYQRPTTFQRLYEPNTVVGTLIGLPPSKSDMLDSDTDSDYVDEDDEDSNAEDWYQNDYPEEEDPSTSEEGGSDEFHEDSDEEDFRSRDIDPYSWR